jgi:hypothetical protein
MVLKLYRFWAGIMGHNSHATGPLNSMCVEIQALSMSLQHGIVNYIDTKAKFLHLKKLTCKGTLRQVFFRVYGLEIQSVMLVFLDPAL